MKKIILVAASTFIMFAASAQSRWNIGIHTGCVTNVSKFESGDEQANAFFNNNHYKSINLGVDFRYKLSSKFSLVSGFSFTEFGFSYGMAKDYSLLEPRKEQDDITANTCITSIPALVVMNTPVNCNNTRFIFGAGFVVRGIDEKWEQTNTHEVTPTEAANSKTTVMTAQTESNGGISPAATWLIGLEKVLKRGNTMSFTFNGTQGFTTIAESTVRYTASNQSYTHTFINRGSFVSFAFAYNFAPFGTKKANKLLQNSVK